MAQEYDQNRVEDPEMNPVALSLTGGFVGTVVGLKKGGVGGAVVGGLVGGTAGYVAGAATDESEGLAPASDVEPINIAVEETDGEDDEDAADDENAVDDESDEN